MSRAPDPHRTGVRAMDGEAGPPRVVVTDAWRREQRAKREAYEAKRRAWTRGLERGAGVGGDGDPPPPTATSGTGDAGDPVAPARRGRRGGMVHDRRQARFVFVF